MISDPLGLFDCSGVSDGSACAIVTTPEIARSLGKKDLVTIKALQLSTSSGRETQTSDWDGSYVANTRIAAARAYKEAGISPDRLQEIVERLKPLSIASLVAAYETAMDETKREGIAPRTDRTSRS